MRLPNPESFKIALDPLRIWVLSTEDLAIRTSEVGQELLGLIDDLLNLRRFEEARVLVRKNMPIARRILGETDESRFRMSTICAWTLYGDPAASLDDLREAMETLEDTARAARRVFGKSHPATNAVETNLRAARLALAARE